MGFDASALPDVSDVTVGIFGATGPQGRGLAYRFARGGLAVRIGSRVAERGEQAAAELAALPGVAPGLVTGGDNGYAAASGVVVVAVPWEGHEATLRSLAPALAGKIVVDCVNPLGFDGRGPFAIPVPEGSAAQQAEALLPETRVTAAFHNVSAVLLADLDQPKVDCDVLVLGDDREATDVVRALADAIPGVRGVFGGRLRNAYQVECLTANLIAINRRYKVHASIKITDLDG